MGGFYVVFFRLVYHSSTECMFFIEAYFFFSCCFVFGFPNPFSVSTFDGAFFWKREIISKVRGQKDEDNPPLHFLAKKILNEGIDLPLGSDFPFITTSTRISTIPDYLLSLKKAVKEENLERIQFPGFTLIETHNFQWNNLDLPYKDYREWICLCPINISILSFNNNLASLLKLLSFEEVFMTRNKEYFDHMNSIQKRRKEWHLA